MFRLVRYFSIASLILFTITIAIVTTRSRSIAVNDMVHIREQSNVDLVQSYANLIWTTHRDFIIDTRTMDAEEILASPQYAAFDETIRQNTIGLSVIKIKIYGLNGMTIYSTNPDDIGVSKTGSLGFETAIAGGVASELVYRDTFNAFENVIQDANIVESYVAIRPFDSEQIEGVIEVYDDVTPLIELISVRQQRVTFGLIAVFAILFVILFYIVSYAEKIIHKQSLEIQHQNMELKSINTKLEHANSVATEAARLKSEFLSTMSHELRTPLNAIIGYSGIMMEGIAGTIDERAIGMVQRINNSGQHLLTLINNVLDISKIEAGRMEIIEDEMDIRDVVADVDMHMRVLAENRGLALNLEVAPTMPETILGDAERIKQILINLLSNGVKFTDEGSVSLHVSADDNMLKMDVVDTGIGIAPHALDYIFDEFRQADGSATRSHQGTGLGLAIVRKFTEAMQGKVSVQSVVGEGSTFTVKIPLKVPVKHEVVTTVKG